jgi:hypothetical protein
MSTRKIVQELERLVNEMSGHMRLKVQTCTRKGATGGGYATQRGKKPQVARCDRIFKGRA